MNKFFTTLTACCTFLIAVTSLTATSSANEYDHIDRFAVKIQSNARSLIKETVHYRHTPNYRQLVSETGNLYRLASHIHNVTHFEGNLVHLEADLRDMDQSYHRIEGLFDFTEHESAYGNGHVHSNTAHVKRMLKSIEDSIHHIRKDVTDLKRATTYRPVYQRPVYQSNYRQPATYPTSRNTHYGSSHGNSHGSGYGSGYGNSYRSGYGSGHGNGGGHGRSQGYSRSNSGIGFSIGGGSSRLEFRF